MNMKNKICLVTGANEGIGLEVARGLASQGAEVVMLCRNAEKAAVAQAEVEKTTGHKPHLLLCDLASQAATRKAAAQFNAQFDRLDVLVHNAGAFFTTRQLSPDGIELQFAINHLSSFLLTHELFPKLKAAGTGARIVITSSNGHYGGRIRWDDYNFDKEKYDGLRAYRQSKIANVLFTFELARRLKPLGITANCLHPGVVRTNIAQKESRGIYRLGWALMKPFMISVPKGAATTLYLASSPEAATFTGQYFFRCKPRRADAFAYDESAARRLWELSETLTHLPPWNPA